jgi:asparagine synthase (glutamine-hydrolysing)
MCGILGVVGSDASSQLSHEAFERALMTLAPRGPDDHGTFYEPEVALGQTRLAIMDVSSAGHQPMHSHDGRYVTVFNGEVYNFGELKKEPLLADVAWRSNSDTEVILELFAREGPRCLERLRGMFALAIWDRSERRLFLARDRLGIKPLYVWRSGNGLGFASELKALRALPQGPREIETEAVSEYLAWGHLPSPTTMLKGVKSLAPATYAVFDGQTLRESRYWSFPAPTERVNTRAEAIESLRPVLREAVRLRCIADVPVGAFLSGGIDSSAIVSLMRSVGQTKLRTFSLTFPGTPLDEATYSGEIARLFETDHTSVAIDEHMIEADLARFLDVMDQPTLDGFNTYLVSKYAKASGLTVALSGLGGDELFGGYPSFRRAERLVPFLEHAPRRPFRATRFAPQRLRGRFAKLEVLGLPGSPAARVYAASHGLFSPSQVRALLMRPVGLSPLPEPENAPTTFAAISQLELRRYTHDQLLRDSDVFGMAHALEIRVPLLDHRLVESVAAVDPSVLLSGFPKSLLCEALPKRLPDLVTKRSKMGFTMPFDRWLRSSWRARVEDVLLGPVLARNGLCSREIERTWRAFLAGGVHWSRPWALFILGRTLAS